MKKMMVAVVACALLAACSNNAKRDEPATGGDAKTETTSTQQPVPATEGAQSLGMLEKQHALVPTDPEVALDLAFAYASNKNQKALPLADSLLKSTLVEKEKAFYIKAEYYNQTGNAGEALKNYNAAIAANYRFLDAHLDRGRLLYRQKKYDEALEAFGRGQQILPREAMFYFWAAKTQEAKGDKQNAKANYERAYVLDKTLSEAKEAAEKL